jgi:hypothetical protein
VFPLRFFQAAISTLVRIAHATRRSFTSLPLNLPFSKSQDFRNLLARFEEMGFLKIEVSQVSRKINAKQRSKLDWICIWESMSDSAHLSPFFFRDNGNQDLPHAERSKDPETLRRLFQARGHCRVESMWDWSIGRFSLILSWWRETLTAHLSLRSRRRKRAKAAKLPPPKTKQRPPKPTLKKLRRRQLKKRTLIQSTLYSIICDCNRDH